MNSSDDQEAISAVLAGDANAYAVLVERYQKPIFNLMYRMTGSHADALDLAQDTFIKAYEQLYRFEEGKKFFPWLYTIGLNRSKNFLRQRKVKQTYSIEDFDPGSGLDHPSQQEDNLCDSLDSRLVQEAVQQLPVDYREAIILRYQEDFSMEDIAEALELSVSGAKMRVHRGIAKLREMLSDKRCGERNESQSAFSEKRSIA
ncbi:RNA polymerase sigma factor [Desulforhabdus amnigena]|uniref:RNA polymerase sigma factor n=1 Tax=Desulforhabdus amnigena TaxID=40218 RepID=A0A9W6FVY0_9BACT|nr:sigma-70 family RNA polymerase sigma factor [Desulforhabdus amnigena]NLJ26998.1 sigma-70 family RNA polymerase sigma factor [Deltaproteobacteria bacterium]GLI35823.1 RNA polymerase sigma factor [Desulforhabdus amnigena]